MRPKAGSRCGVTPPASRGGGGALASPSARLARPAVPPSATGRLRTPRRPNGRPQRSGPNPPAPPIPTLLQVAQGPRLTDRTAAASAHRARGPPGALHLSLHQVGGPVGALAAALEPIWRRRGSSGAAPPAAPPRPAGSHGAGGKLRGRWRAAWRFQAPRRPLKFGPNAAGGPRAAAREPIWRGRGSSGAAPPAAPLRPAGSHGAGGKARGRWRAAWRFQAPRRPLKFGPNAAGAALEGLMLGTQMDSLCTVDSSANMMTDYCFRSTTYRCLSISPIDHALPASS